jgi:hypothetical protein
VAIERKLTHNTPQTKPIITTNDAGFFMISLSKNGSFVLFAVLAFSLFGFSATGLAETVICSEVDSKISYKLDFNWTNDTVEISSRYDNKAYKKLFKAATAVRNNANDKRFLAEGTVKQYVGGGKDCSLVETLFFDASNAGGEGGTLQKSAALMTKSGSCNAKIPAPDLSANTVQISCR